MSERSRRSRGVKDGGRVAALEKLRAAKARGDVHKAEVAEELDALYDEVPEEDYARLVQSRQEDDWIVDDDGAGYVEDGREIFDDDRASRREPNAKAPKDHKPKNRNIADPAAAKRSIKGFFGPGKAHPSAAKKRDAEEDDAILGELLEELDDDKPTKAHKPHHVHHPPTAKRPRPSHGTPNSNPFSVSRSKATPPAPKESLKSPPSPTVTNERPPAKEIPDQDPEEAEEAQGPEPEESLAETLPTDDEPMSVSPVEEEESAPPSVTELKSEPAEHRGFATVKQEEAGLESWGFVGEAEAGEEKENAADVSLSGESQELPLSQDEEGRQCLDMFWLDAYEDAKHPGRAFVFGKVRPSSGRGPSQSCCVTVRGLERVLFFLPRAQRLLPAGQEGDEVGFKDLHDEITDLLLRRFHIKQFRARKTTKKWAMGGHEVPAEASYLEVRYQGHLPQLPQDLSGETFSLVLGTTNSTLESLLLEKNLRGPSWLRLTGVESVGAKVSYCAVEGKMESPEGISVVPSASAPPPPTLSLASLSLLALPHPSGRHDTIVAASLVTKNSLSLSGSKEASVKVFDSHFCLVTGPPEVGLPYDFKQKMAAEGVRNVVKVERESVLVDLLLKRLQAVDPDVIVGHDLLSLGIEQLLSRVGKDVKWSRLSRLKRSGPAPRLSVSKAALGDAIAGRLILDSATAAKELVRARSYDLSELASQLLGVAHEDHTAADALAMFRNSNDLIRLLNWLRNSALLSLRLNLHLNSLPLFLSITQIVGGVLSRTLMGGRSERNEFLLLHAFHDKGYLFPDKYQRRKPKPAIKDSKDPKEAKDEAKPKKGPQYSGGLVLEPKKGLYDKYVLLLDFNSLYPSIIQEYNICFTTVAESGPEAGAVPAPGLPWGILPTQIRSLVEKRKEVKSLLKKSNLAPELASQYNIRQMGLKLTANSMYGCLGFAQSRFHAQALAALVTAKGREILTNTQELVQRKGLDVIYGDTDSIMIHTNSDSVPKVLEIAAQVKREVNKLYRLVELDMDGMYRSLLLLKKKKYAGLAVEQDAEGQWTKTKREMKGLDIVRRDWAGVAKETGAAVVDEILSGKPREAIVEAVHRLLRDLAEKMRAGQVPLPQFEIHKSLTKAPGDYADPSAQPHVSVALRLNSQHGWHLKAGDTIPYIICLDGTERGATQRAYHQTELLGRPELKVDLEYYLSSQLHPVVSRLCEPVEGTDAGRVAASLGLDSKAYARAVRSVPGAQEEEVDELDGLRDGAQQLDWSKAEPLRLSCPSKDCSEGGVELGTATVEVGGKRKWSLWAAKCGCGWEAVKDGARAEAELRRSVGAWVGAYYAGWLRCEDAGCGWETRRVPVRLSAKGRPLCPRCSEGCLVRKLSDRQLYTQLAFFRRLFHESGLDEVEGEEERGLLRAQLEGADGDVARRLRHVAQAAADSSAYAWVDLATLFRPLTAL